VTTPTAPEVPPAKKRRGWVWVYVIAALLVGSRVVSLIGEDRPTFGPSAPSSYQPSTYVPTCRQEFYDSPCVTPGAYVAPAPPTRTPPATSTPAPRAKAERIEQVFQVPAGGSYAYTFTAAGPATIEFSWTVVNRNSAGAALGAGALAAGVPTGSVGASDGTPGPVDVFISGGYRSGNWQFSRSIQNAVTIDALTPGWGYTLRFDNSFSLVTAKDVTLVVDVKPR
jgi:hypothetical protein